MKKLLILCLTLALLPVVAGCASTDHAHERADQANKELSDSIAK